MQNESEITKLNAKISEIKPANFAIHNEIGDTVEWLDQWREDMGAISISLFAWFRYLEENYYEIGDILKVSLPYEPIIEMIDAKTNENLSAMNGCNAKDGRYYRGVMDGLKIVRDFMIHEIERTTISRPKEKKDDEHNQRD